MICSRCNKRIAVVFMTRVEGADPINEGLCLTCAKELGIPQVNTMMENMGISDEDIEQMGQQIMGIVDEDKIAEASSASIPNFISNIFSKDASNTDLPKNTAKSIDSDDNVKSLPNTEETNKNNKKPKDEKTSKRKFLETYCTDLTGKARAGKLDKVIGRDKEIERVVQILSRRSKNNPCLIGEPGVGKTAIAEGIAQRIIDNQVPFRLIDKEIFLLDLTALVAGTQFRGQFESRVKGLIDEVRKAKNIILFIDEVHTIVGTGDSEGSMSAANILKPSLSRGEIQVIGATTFNEYRKYIEKDSALERRFQPITINELTMEETIEVLKGIKEYYSSYHHVKISDEILIMCANLSERYINDRFLPDKAIDLLDESCSCCSLKSKELTVYEQLNRKLKSLYDEEKEIESENDTKTIDYEKLAQVKSETIKIKNELIKLEPIINKIEVSKEDVAKVIELCTGIPSTKIQQSDLMKIKNLDQDIKSKIIGQSDAIDLVVSSIKRSRVGLYARKKPASFIFVGPTGVGKTELVKVLADKLFHTVDPLIRIDMSEYMEKYAVSRLVGAAPGYVGHEESGQLTEKVRRKPYSVILFDEIEKAHPDVMNILLQILDEGRITDSHGRTVDFSNTVVAMTSNAGSNDTNGVLGFNKSNAQVAKDKAMKALSEFLRPEFIARVDEIVVFNPLDENNLFEISKLMLNELKKPLAEQGIKLSYTDAVSKKITEISKDGKYAARDLRKTIRKEIECKIANILVDKCVNLPNNINIDIDNDKNINIICN